MSPGADKTLRLHKAELLGGGQVSGRIVELGPGLGSSIKYYASPDRVTELLLVEPNAHFHEELRAEALRCGLPADRVKVLGAPAETALAALPDNSVDAVIAVLVLCSVADQRVVLAEAQRVLKPGVGRLLVLEHVAACESDPRPTAARLQQRFLQGSGLWSFCGDGCQLTRATGDVIRSMPGWSESEARGKSSHGSQSASAAAAAAAAAAGPAATAEAGATGASGGLRRIAVTKYGAWLPGLQPHVLGSVTKAAV